MLSPTHEYISESVPPSTPTVSDVFSKEIIEKIGNLPIREGIALRFVDYDDTIFDANRRFAVDPKLAEYRGDLAYGYLANTYKTDVDSTGFDAFVELLDPKNHLLDYSSFYNPLDLNHTILTAGNKDYQRRKIVASGLGGANQILVKSATEKPQAILEYILALGYIPGKVVFIDDRINDFLGMDTTLSEILDTPVEFYRATPNRMDRSVHLELVTTETKTRVSELLAA